MTTKERCRVSYTLRTINGETQAIYAFLVGDEVKFSTPFLRSTSQFSGPEAPTSWGPFAKGHITIIRGDICTILWANGQEGRIHFQNLCPADFHPSWER